MKNKFTLFFLIMLLGISAFPQTIHVTLLCNDTVLCEGSCTQLSAHVTGASGLVTFTWTPMSGLSGNDSVKTACPIVTTTYKVVVEDALNHKDSATAVIHVDSLPDPTLTDPMSNFNNCANAAFDPSFTITVFNSSSSSNSSYTIIWGDGTPNYTSTNFVFTTHTYSTLGIYSLVFQVTGTNGCVASQTYTVTNISNPAISFGSPGGTQGCGPKTICFNITNYSNNHSSTTYTVDFGDGSPKIYLSHPPPDSICHTYTTTSCGYNLPYNCFIASITAINACDSTKITVNSIKIYTKAQAGFIAPWEACINQPVTFTNTSVGGYNNSCTSFAALTWNFGDGTIINTTNPGSQIHTYTSYGSFIVTLTVSNYCGTDSIKHTICIKPSPIAKFKVSDSTFCKPGTVFIINQSNVVSACGTTNYAWNVTCVNDSCGNPGCMGYSYISGTNGYSVNPILLFTTPGKYTITLTADDGCAPAGTFSKTIHVETKPTISLSGITSPICQGQSIAPSATYTNCYSTISSYLWTFTGGTPPSSTSPIPGTIMYNSPGTFPISITAGNACGDTTVTSSITVKPLPTATQVNNIAVCPGAPIGSISFSSSPTGATYSWTNSNTAIGLGASGTGNIPGWNAPANGTGANITGTINVTPTLNGCSGSVMSFTVTIYPTPTVTQLSNIAVCPGAIINVPAFTSNLTGTTYSWTNSNTSIGLGASGTGNIPSWIAPANGTTSNINGTITVTPTSSNGCTGSPMSFTVTIYPTPTVTQLNNIATCPGATITIPAFTSNLTGTTFSWTNNNISIGLGASGTGNILSWTAPANATGSNITGTITVTPSKNGCTGPPMSFTVTIYPTPAATQLSNIAVCPGATITVPAFSSNLTGTTYTWTNNNTSIGLGAFGSGNIPPWTAPANGTISNITGTIIVTPLSSNGCLGSPMLFTISIYPTPTVTQFGDIAVCPGATITVPVFTSNLTGTTYTWTNSNTSIGLGASGSGNIPSWTAPANGTAANITGTITVTPTSTNGCTGLPMNFTVTIYPTPTVTQLSNIAVCPGTTITVPAFTGNMTGTIYSWTNNNTAIGLGSSSSGNINPWTAPANATGSDITGTIVVTPSKNGCSGPSMSFTVSIYPTPTVTQLSNIAVCPAATITIPAFSSNLTGTTYSWTNSNISIGLGASGTGNIPSWTAPANGTSSNITGIITVTPTSTNGCTGIPMNFTVAIYPTPTATQLSNIAVCPGAIINVPTFTSNLTGTTYSWTNSNTSIGLGASGTGNIPSWTAPANGTISNITGTITVTPTSANGCIGSAMSFTVTIYPTPTVTQLNNIAVCPGATINVPAFTSNLTGTTYSWSNSNIAIGLGASGTGNISSWTAPSNTTGSNITGTIIVTPLNNGCTGPSMSFTVTIYPAPVITQIHDTTVCPGMLINFGNFISVPSGTINWTNSNTAIGLAASGTGNIAPWVAPPNGTGSTISGTITVTSTSVNGCVSAPMTFVVGITTKFNMTASPMVQTICSNVNTNISLQASYPGVTFSWTVSSPPGITGASAGSGSAINQFLINTTSGLDTVRYTITSSIGGCSSDPIIVKVAVYPFPIVTQLNNIAVCPAAIITISTFTGNLTGITFSWTNSNVSIGLGAFGSGNISSWTAPANGTSADITGTISVTPLSTDGCYGTAMNFTVTIYPTPTVTQLSNIAVCPAATITVSAFTGNLTGTAYSWTNSNTQIGLGASGTGSINSWIAPSNTTGSNITGTITVTPSKDGCIGPPMSFTVTIYPTPTVTPVGNIAVCPTLTITVPPFASNLTGTTFSWTNNNTSIGLGPSGTGNIPSWAAPVNGTTSNITGTITVMPVSPDGCTGNPISFTITIYPTPSVTQVSNITVCPGQQINIGNFVSVPSGNTINWINTNTAIGLAANGTGNIPSWTAPPNGTFSNITGTITVTPTSVYGCVGAPMNFNVNIAPLPNATAIPMIQIICSNTSTNISLGSSYPGTTFSWTVSSPPGITGASTGSGASINQTLTNTTNVTDTVLYTITPTLGGCSGTSIIVKVAVYPIPTITQISNIAVCPAATISVPAFSSNLTGTTYNWTNNNTSIGIGASGSGNIASWTAPANGTTSNITGTIIVTPISTNGCPGPVMSFTVTIYPTPTVTQLSNIAVCPAATITVSAFTGNLTGTTYSWTNANTQIGLGASGSGNIPSWIAPSNATGSDIMGTITVTSSKNGCTGPPMNFTVTIYPIPTITQISNIALCPTLTITVPDFTSNLTGTTFSWTNNNTSIGLGPSGTGNISSWTAPANGTISNIMGTITVTPVSPNGCYGIPMSFTVTIYPTPSVTQVSNISVCPGQQINIGNFVSVPPGNTINWTNTNTAIGLSANGTGNIPSWTAPPNGTSSGITGTITVTPTSTNGCTGLPMNFTVTIYPTPMVTQLNNIAVCPGATINVPAFTSNLTGTTYSWSNSYLAIGLGASGTGNISSWAAPANATSSNITGTIIVTPSKNGCSGSPMSFTVTIYPTPTVTQLSNIAACPAATITIPAFSSNLTGTTYSWTNSNISIGLGASGTGNIPSWTAPANGTLSNITGTITVTPTSTDGCTGMTMNFTVVIYPTLTATQLSNIAVCPGAIINVPAFTSNLTGTTYTWTNNNTSIGLGASGSGNIPSWTAPANGTISNITGIITVTPTSANGCIGSAMSFTVTIYPTPTVTQLNNIVVCPGATINVPAFTSNLTGTTYSWSNSNLAIGLGASGTGNISSWTAPSNTTGSNITGTITVTPSKNGCSGPPMSFTVTIYPTPTVTQMSNIAVCPGQQINIGNFVSVPSGNTINWTNTNTAIGLAASGTGNIAPWVAPPNGTGSTITGTISVTATSVNGCVSAPMTFNVNIAPVPDVTATPMIQSICSNINTNISLGSSYPGTTFSWTVYSPSGITGASAGSGTSINQTLINTTGNTDTVKYTITPTLGSCSGSPIVVEVIVFHATIVNANPSSQTICSGDQTNISLSSTPPNATFSWTVNAPNGINGATNDSGSLINQTLINTTNSTLVVNYNVTSYANNCPGSLSVIPVTVYPLPNVSFSHDTLVCKGNIVQFYNNTFGGQSYLWNFGDGYTSTLANPTHTYLNQDYYTINLIATSVNGCINSASDTIHVIQIPTPEFSVSPGSGCAPFNVLIQDQTAGSNVSYYWDFGIPPTSTSPGPFNLVYPQGLSDTTYMITLTTSNLCGSAIHNDSVVVDPMPVVNFYMSQDSGCSPLPIQFLDAITGLPDMLKWDFGDGTPVITSINFNNPIIHTFFYFGINDTIYTINLIAINECGSDTMQQKVTVYPNTVNAFFNIDTPFGCEPLTIHFTNYSTGNNQSSWDFGDGNVSNSVSPTHTYTSPGQFVVMLAVTNGCSFDTTYSNPITVHPLAVPNFTFNDNVCRGDTVFFINIASGITSFSWNFGDGSPESTLSNPYHVYNTSGTFTLTLTVNNQFNCSSDTMVPVHIRFVPHAFFTTNSSGDCSPLTKQFANHTDSLSYNTYIWYFNNGNSSVMITPPLQTFTNYSNCIDTVYNVILIANNANCTDTFYSSITVHPSPLSNFSTDDSIFCGFDAPVSVQFNQQSLCAQGFQWYIGNNLVSASPNPVITFPGTATYSVSLVSSNQYQCADTATKKFIVYPDLEDNLVINPASGCEPLGVEFEMLADSLNYIWEFGDNTTSTLSNPFHLYQNEGVYSVHIYITGDGGCTDSLVFNNTINVYPTAQASFTYQNIHEPPPNNGSVLFTNTSQDATSFIWDFGDGIMYYGVGTIHKYLSNNYYDVILIANNQYNCPDTVTDRIILDFFHGLFIPNAFSPTNSNSLVQNFQPVGVGLETFHIQVYNTWGNIIWESTALDAEGRPTEFWNGKTKDGKLLPMDAYVWRASGTFKDGCIWPGMDYGDGKCRNYGTVTILK